jgi:putative oxidoreductase
MDMETNYPMHKSESAETKSARWTYMAALRRYLPLALRLALGLFFIYHGLSKFGLFGGDSLQKSTGFFAEKDIPFPTITSPVLALLEGLAGMALVAGIATRVFALLLAAVVTGEIIVVKLPIYFSPRGEFFFMELSLLVGLLVLAWLGPGSYALDEEPPHEQ